MRSFRTEKAKKIRAANMKKGIDYAPFRERQFEVRDDGKFGALTANASVDNLLSNMESVRRLTPLECERLQGFPDNWTKYGIIEGKKVALSDSRRYQLIGNAVSVPVVQTVGVPSYKTFFPNKKPMKLATTTLGAPLEGLGKADMKTPITYYGGKQNMSKLIVSLIPEHNLYCEPFVGGAAVFFAKHPSPVEVLNDLNGEVVNFYQVCKSDYNKLNKKIQATPHSRKLHSEAAAVLHNAENHKPLDRAWAFWVQTNMSFSARMFGGYAYERKSNSTVKRLFNKKMAFTEDICKRLDFVDLESNDAIKVIQSRDTPGSFFYVDPPYFNSNMGHYDGYTEKDFVVLLTILSKIKGKFLLSSYPSMVLKKFTKKYKWIQWSRESRISVTKNTKKSKTEVLTGNYDFLKMMPEGLSGTHNAQNRIVLRAKALKLRMELKG